MIPTIVVEGLTRFLAGWGETANSEGYLIGLFQYPWTGDFESDMDSIMPCDFGGYEGLQELDSWDVAGITPADPRVILTHPEIVWTADGTTTNLVGGYYVCTSTLILLYVVPRDEGAETIGSFFGQTYTAAPVMRYRTELL